MELDEFAQHMEEEYSWDEKVPELKPRDMEAPASRIDTIEEAEVDDVVEERSDQRTSLEEDQFVDALTSPTEQPTDWAQFPTGTKG
jgi:hypothetical protein